MNPEFTVAILAFVAFSIPVIGALWKIFSVRERLASDIRQVICRIELLEQKLEALVDRQTLAFNGLKEITEHTRSRSQTQEQKLNDRLNDVERYLEKHTEFQCRRS
jgi:hypothetical protein